MYCRFGTGRNKQEGGGRGGLFLRTFSMLQIFSYVAIRNGYSLVDGSPPHRSGNFVFTGAISARGERGVGSGGGGGAGGALIIWNTWYSRSRKPLITLLSRCNYDSAGAERHAVAQAAFHSFLYILF